jgi:hypothetical protein
MELVVSAEGAVPTIACIKKFSASNIDSAEVKGWGR